MGLAVINKQLIFKKSVNYDSNQNLSKSPSPISASLIVKSTSLQDIIFKIRSTSVEKFKVYPSIGVLSPGTSQPSKVIWKSEVPLQSLSSERFQVQVIAIPRNISITPFDPLSAGRCTCENVIREVSKEDWSTVKDLKTAWEKLSRLAVESEKHNVLCVFSHNPGSDPTLPSSPRSTQRIKSKKETMTKGRFEVTTTDEEITESDEDTEQEFEPIPADLTEELCIKTGNYLWKFLAVASTILFSVFTFHILGLIPPKTEYLLKLPVLIKETFVAEPVPEVPETWFTMLISAKDAFLDFFGYRLYQVLGINYYS
ncbi:unnamed protein product [Allacma fusca]|uniref:MSP domain-containing protein n=1 Tax=Allacma fusca TaxID=39272 RepID=A0A8J2Q635_9HEXA|nr:unnamed protein product [Allacma fusca]